MTIDKETQSGPYLEVVGLGLSYGLQLTRESEAAIRLADRVAYVASDPAAAHWIESLREDAVSLNSLYSPSLDRRETYEHMVDMVLGWLEDGQSVCFAAYGHPGHFAWATHESIRRARSKGIAARMLPGISTDAAFCADAGFDPAVAGCQTWDATRYLVHQHDVSPRVPLLLLQPSAVGVTGLVSESEEHGLSILLETLAHVYGPDHDIVVYEAAVYPGTDPLLDAVPIRCVLEYVIPPLVSFFVPPLAAAPDTAVAETLGRPDLAKPPPQLFTLRDARRRLKRKKAAKSKASC